jgi:transcriptional regulator with XRE-family HTH domain
MDPNEARKRFGVKLQALRLERQRTQEQLAEAVNKSTEHISFLERGERSPSFELLFDLANALETTVADLLDERPDATAIAEAIEVELPDQPLPQPAQPTPANQERQQSDLERLNLALAGVRDLQSLASEYGIADVFQDNGGKVLQVLILLGLRISPGREGNDAIDADGNEYELKTVNRALNASAGITTHHHLNRDILQKYRNVRAWYIALYEGIELVEIYRIPPADLELKFREWEAKVERTGVPLNNPKIPMRLVRAGQRVYPTTRNTLPDPPTTP